MTLARYCRPVVNVGLDEPVAVAARKLRDDHVGCVVVVRDGRPFGILTDRDIAIRVVAAEREASRTRVVEVATLDPVVVRDVESVEAAAKRMRAHGVRRLPVVDDLGYLQGIVTLDDILRQAGREISELAASLEASADASDAR